MSGNGPECEHATKEAVVDRYFELWRKQTTDGLAEIFAPNARYVVKPFGEQEYVGLGEIEHYWRTNTIAKLVDPQPEILTTAYGAGVVFVEWETHYQSPEGQDKIMRGILLMEFEDGLIKELREHFSSTEVK